jgi:hypothetical protein
LDKPAAFVTIEEVAVARMRPRAQLLQGELAKNGQPGISEAAARHSAATGQAPVTKHIALGHLSASPGARPVGSNLMGTWDRFMAADPQLALTPSEIGIHLYWIPLGAGGAGYVRLNGRIYELVKARLAGRKPLHLYHTALEVVVPAGRFTIENAWPSPDAATASRGVVLEGPVFSRRIARFRPFRYEVRCWRDGVIPDAAEAVASPQHVSNDLEQARRLLDLAASVPELIWGRDELDTGEMWNSNSVVAWLLVRSGVSLESIHPPAGGRAPGWSAGIAAANSWRQA